MDLIQRQESSQLLRQMKSQLRNQLLEPLYSQVKSQTDSRIDSQVRNQVWSQLKCHLLHQLGRQLTNKLLEQLRYHLKMKLVFHVQNYMRLKTWAGFSSWFDYSISAFNFDIVQSKWLTFQSLVKDCDWLLPYEKTCIVCDRPTKLSFDSENRLHAEGEPAIQFTDGYSLYSYHGITLPEKYGKLPPSQWQAQWLLEENNTELRQVLIQGIGYETTC